MLFDSHINIHSDLYDEDREEVLQRARSAGISRFLAICDQLNNYEQIVSLTESEIDIWRTVGVHPHYAKDYQHVSMADLVRLASERKVVGIGETGLDQYYGHSGLEDQMRLFRKHIHAARDLQMPVVIHTRDADDAMIGVLREEMQDGAFKFLMHCYTSGAELAQVAADLGGFFSVSGIVTFKNANDVRAVAKNFPQDRVILETDCPYLSPTPHRGRRNEPAYLVEVCKFYADLMGVDNEAMAKMTTQNCLALFDRIGKDDR